MAQASAPPAGGSGEAASALFANGPDIRALIAKAQADRKEGAPLTIEPVLSLAPYRANLEYRTGLVPASLHETEAEFVYVVSGRGALVSGGQLVGATRINAANMSGTGVENGNSLGIDPGSMALIPEQTPHQIIPAAGETLVLITMRLPRPVPPLK